MRTGTGHPASDNRISTAVSALSLTQSYASGTRPSPAPPSSRRALHSKSRSAFSQVLKRPPSRGGMKQSYNTFPVDERDPLIHRGATFTRSDALDARCPRSFFQKLTVVMCFIHLFPPYLYFRSSHRTRVPQLEGAIVRDSSSATRRRRRRRLE